MTGRNGMDRAGNDAAAREALDVGADAATGGGASRGPAGVDPKTGEVTGAGSGSGGGNAGEDYDDDHTAGSNTAR